MHPFRQPVLHKQLGLIFIRHRRQLMTILIK